MRRKEPKITKAEVENLGLVEKVFKGFFYFFPQNFITEGDKGIQIRALYIYIDL